MLVPSVLALLVTTNPSSAAPRIWLEHTDVPVALTASNDTGTEVKGCRAEWTIRYDGGRHYTEVALVDLPAKGEVKVNDCHDWWNLSWSKTMDVTAALYGPDGSLLGKESYDGVFKLVPRQGLPTDGWTAAACRGNPAAAFDANLGTRWDTGRAQEVGDWFTLDMGKPQRIAGLILDSRQSANDYPSGLAVFVAEDGMKWTCVADIPDTESLNQAGRIALEFGPVSARYINLLLTRPHGPNWFWSIHELSVLPADGRVGSAAGSNTHSAPAGPGKPGSVSLWRLPVYAMASLEVVAERGGSFGTDTISGVVGPKWLSVPRLRWPSATACLVPALPAPPVRAAEAQRTVLAFSFTGGFRHSACAYGKPILTQIGEESGKFRVICSEDPKVINEAFLKGIACLVLNNSTGSYLDDTGKAALLNFAKNGGGVVGIHAATDSFYDWPEYREMIGGSFDGHPWSEQIAVRVEVPDFPACRGVPNPWVVGDEIYQHRDWSRDQVCVLMSLDPKGTDLNKPGAKRADKDYGIAWCRTYGQGRVLYAALGHWEQVWDSPIYRTHLLNGILWAMGEIPGECTPHPKPQ